MNTIQEFVDRYNNADEMEAISPEAEVVSLSTRISLRAKIRLDFIADSVGKKKTPLLGEIIEISINEIFDKLDFEPELEEGYNITMMNAGFRKG